MLKDVSHSRAMLTSTKMTRFLILLIVEQGSNFSKALLIFSEDANQIREAVSNLAALRGRVIRHTKIKLLLS